MREGGTLGLSVCINGVEQDEGGRENKQDPAAQSVLDRRPQSSLENKRRHAEKQHTL